MEKNQFHSNRREVHEYINRKDVNGIRLREGDIVAESKKR